MTIEALAAAVLAACEAESVAYMLTGAFAFNYYGIPRATKDVDVVIELPGHDPIPALITRLSELVQFDEQVQFDTLTWGKRQVGVTRESPPLKVELFELFEDPFVRAQFERRRLLRSAEIGREAWLPTPEDVVVQKLRWGRNKDLDDARDVLAVQEPEKLDMEYIRRWCVEHETTERLDAALAEIPPM